MIYAFLGYAALKNGFSKGLSANFHCVARRHSLKRYSLLFNSYFKN